MNGNKPYIYYSAPVKNAEDNVIAALMLATNAKWLYSLIEKDRLGKGVVCVLSDKHGVRIAHASDRNLLFKSWILCLPPSEKNLSQKKLWRVYYQNWVYQLSGSS